MAYSKSKSIIESKVSDASFETIKQVASNLDVIYKTYEDLSLQIIIDKDFHTYVRTMIEAQDDYTRFEASRSLNDKMQNYIMGNNTIVSLMLLPLNPKLEPLATGSASNAGAEKLMESEWFKETVAKKGKPIGFPLSPMDFLSHLA